VWLERSEEDNRGFMMSPLSFGFVFTTAVFKEGKVADPETQHIFLIHGIGKHQEGWSNPLQKRIKELLKRYTPYHDLDDAAFKKVLDFIEITYDDCRSSAKTRVFALFLKLQIRLSSAIFKLPMLQRF